MRLSYCHVSQAQRPTISNGRIRTPSPRRERSPPRRDFRDRTPPRRDARDRGGSDFRDRRDARSLDRPRR
jgi:hypothetical protein